MSVSIPGLNTLYAILKRNIDVRNATLASRQQHAKELHENCHMWSRVLVDTFDKTVHRWETEGKDAAFREMDDLIRDFLKLDYYSLRSDSPILQFLDEDLRFKDFVESCIQFYESALNIKRLVYGDIEQHPGEYVTANEVGIEGMINLWKAEVRKTLDGVRYNYHTVAVLQTT